MKHETIAKVADVLNAWNPLGEKANSIEGLNGYRIEAIDIISTMSILSGHNKVEKAIAQVLSQAFKIKLENNALLKATEEISNILASENKPLN